MKRKKTIKISHFFSLRFILFLSTFQFLFSQIIFPENPQEFKEVFATDLQSKADIPQVQNFLSRFVNTWDAAYILDNEKQALIKRLNELARKKKTIYPVLMAYVDAFLSVKEVGGFVRVDLNSFFETTDTAFIVLNDNEVVKYLNTLSTLIMTGEIFRSSVYQWHLVAGLSHLKMGVGRDTITWKYFYYPALIFKGGKLSYVEKRDTFPIMPISGELDLLRKHLYVRKARYDWRRLGIPPNELYVDLWDFFINLNRRYFSSQNARLYYPAVLNKPLYGIFSENFSQKGRESTFPRFEGIEGGIVMPNILPHVDYKGGFALRGLKKYGFRYYERIYYDPEDSTLYDEIKKPASLIIRNKDDKKVIKLEANEFALDESALRMQNARVVIYLEGGDSLFHPNMNVKYDVKTQDIFLDLPARDRRSRQGILSSYHRFFLYFETIKWNPNSNKMEFTALVDKEHKRMALESFDYFVQYRYNQFKGILPFHPLGIIYRFIRDNNNPSYIFMTDILQQYHLEKYEKAFEYALLDIEGSGFIEFDEQTGQIIPLEKFYRWVYAALKKKDYDALQIVSQVKSGNHAELDYETKNLTVYGVGEFYFSDSQAVRVLPHKKTIVVGKDRDIFFGGTINAGKIDLYAKKTGQFYFDYTDFKIYCDSIDSLKFFPTRDPFYNASKNPRLTEALKKLKLEGLSGALYIDKPDNKSGKKSLGEYPIFDCYTNAYVYWRDSSIQGGVYRPEIVQFVIDPFAIDSLEYFDIAALQLLGTFQCDSIMPSFRDTLMPVADNTYGIHEKLPEEGVPVYGGKGRFYNEITMDSYGFHGNGTLTFLETTAKSDTFLFHPDSVMATTYEFHQKGGAYSTYKIPEITGGKIGLKWYPKEEKMVLTTLKEPVELYNGKARFSGEIYISPEGTHASGILDFPEVQISSTYFNFMNQEFDATIATFRVKDTSDTSKTLFIAEKVNVHYDVTRDNATFQTTTPGQPNAFFAQAQYRTSLGMGYYDKNKRQIHLKVHEVYPKNNFLESTNPDQHGLRFYANEVLFSLDSKRLDVTGVDSILVADAIVYPDQGKVKIKPDGTLDHLSNAKLVINQTHYWHQFINAEIDILSGIAYTGSGDRFYIDINGVPQYIHFDKIITRPDTVSYAVAFLTEDDHFFLTERIYFRDSVEMMGNRRFLRFNGEVRIQSSNPFFRESWFQFADIVNPDSVFIPVVNPRDKAKRELTVGVHYIPLRRTYYSNFLQPRREPKTDIDVLLAQGGLTFDRSLKAFKIGPREKLEQKQFHGNVVTYNDSTNTITSTGRFKLQFFAPPSIFQIDVGGKFVDNQEAYLQTTDWTIGIRIPDFPNKVLDLFLKRFMRVAMNAEDINLKNRAFWENLSELTIEKDPEEKTLKELYEKAQKINISSQIKIAEAFPQYTFLFSNVQFKFDPDEKVFYTAKPVGIIGINGTTLNKMMDAKIMYSIGYVLPNRQRTPDTLRIYLEFNKANWFYFEFFDVYVRTVCSYDNYNFEIANLVQKSTEKVPDKEKPQLLFQEANAATKEEFIKRMAHFILKQ